MNIMQSLRIIFRNKTYSLLNIVGLAVGIASAGLILLWVEDEVTFDNFPKSDNLHYAFINYSSDGKAAGTQFFTSAPLADALKDDIAGVKRVSRVKRDTRYWGVGENVISETGGFVDSTFFSMFDVNFVLGNKALAFNTTQSVVISESMAAKLFVDDNPVGKMLKMNERDFQITGVYSDIRKNSSFGFNWMIPIEMYRQEMSRFMDIYQWGANHMFTVVELEHHVQPSVINEMIYDLHERKTDWSGVHFFLYPLSRKHLYGNFSDGVETGKGYIVTIRIFTGIAFIIILIACVNFMNLATARSQKRSLEVGVRKTFGGSRLKLVSQFLTESALVTLMAMALAVVIAALALPFYNTLIDRQLVLDSGKLTHWAGLLGVGLLCCLLAGSYPAFYLSSFPSIDMLKRLKTKAGIEFWFRRGLVVFQFSVSLILIICTAFIYLQVRHLKNRPLGMNFEHVLTMEASGEIIRNFEPLKQTLLNTGAVSDVALSGHSMLQILEGWGFMNWPGKPDDFEATLTVSMVSSGMLSVLGLELVEGRDFEPNMPEYGYMIINESLAELMGDEGRVGGRLRQGDHGDYAEIIGVVKNFVYNNMSGISQNPLVLWHTPSRTNYLFIRLHAGDVQTALSKVGAVMKVFNPGRPFDYRFMEDSFNRLFHSEQFIGKLALLFAALAIFISCLGLFGLTAFSAEQRTREIGIRKVMGASVWSIIQLLGRNFLFLILVSFVIALPLAWLLVQWLLSDFEYRINASWTVFAAACLLVMFIAMLTVSVLSLKAAMENPVKAIKSE